MNNWRWYRDRNQVRTAICLAIVFVPLVVVTILGWTLS
jgi:hypothetical protein